MEKLIEVLELGSMGDTGVLSVVKMWLQELSFVCSRETAYNKLTGFLWGLNGLGVITDDDLETLTDDIFKRAFM